MPQGDCRDAALPHHMSYRFRSACSRKGRSVGQFIGSSSEPSFSFPDTVTSRQQCADARCRVPDQDAQKGGHFAGLFPNIRGPPHLDPKCTGIHAVSILPELLMTAFLMCSEYKNSAWFPDFAISAGLPWPNSSRGPPQPSTSM